MIQSGHRFALGIVLLLSLLTRVPGQERQQFYKPPETTAEFWRYMNHEIELGQYRIAAGYLKSFIAKNPSDEELLIIHDKEGSSVFLRLLTIPETSKDARPLIDRVDALVQKHLSDRKRLDSLIENLHQGPEERSYAVEQLRRSGALAVPALVDALLRTANDLDRHKSIVTALPRLDKRSVPPLLAALDSNDANLKVVVIQVMRTRAETGAAVDLWHHAASPKENPVVRETALKVLSDLQGVPVQKLPAAKAVLTQLAEKYYRHEVALPATGPVTVWQWDGKQLVSQGMTVSQAEEYYGLRYARQSLDLDPTYRPAQLVFLSLALDKAVERAGIDQWLSKGSPAARSLAASVSPELLLGVLDQALASRRLNVIVGAARALGELQAGIAAQPGKRGSTALIRALSFPDRRVQLAAAEALLRIGGKSTPPYAARIVEILRRTIASDAATRVLIADGNRDRGNGVAMAVRQGGFDTVAVSTGRQVLARLAEAGDVDALIIDSSVSNPLLAQTIANLRADANAGLLPVLVTAAPEDVVSTRLRLESFRNVWVMSRTLDEAEWKNVLQARIAEALGKPISPAERRDHATRAMEWLARLARGEVTGYDIRPAETAILKAIQSKDLALLAVEVAGRFQGEAPQRELLALLGRNEAAEGLRSLAAVELCRSIQRAGSALTSQQVRSLQATFDSLPEGNLKANVALVLGSLHPDDRENGERLQKYTPNLSSQPAAKQPTAEKQDDTDK